MFTKPDRNSLPYHGDHQFIVRAQFQAMHSPLTPGERAKRKRWIATHGYCPNPFPVWMETGELIGCFDDWAIVLELQSEGNVIRDPELRLISFPDASAVRQWILDHPDNRDSAVASDGQQTKLLKNILTIVKKGTPHTAEPIADPNVKIIGGAKPQALKRFGQLLVDPETGEVEYGRAKARFERRHKPFQIFKYLAERSDRKISLTTLEEAIWGPTGYATPRTIQVNVSRFRQELRRCGGNLARLARCIHVNKDYAWLDLADSLDL